MKTILVTGGAGFVGSRLCARLQAEGHSVISLDNYFTGSKENHVSGVTYREGHTKDIMALVPEKPELVFHLGEYSRVEKSFEEPARVFDLNLTGTAAVVEYCRTHKAKLVYAGSSTKFGDGGMGRDQSPYAFSKAQNTELVRNYGTWYGLSYAISYFYNVYGPGERAGAYGTVIEIFRQKALRGEVLPVNAPGTQKRNFTHVEDIVDALVLIGEKGEGDDFGIGDTDAYSILDVANLYGAAVEMRPEVKGNRMTSDINTEKTRALGWNPSRKLADYINDCKHS
jgi:UDP-glucose 4-epimerase